MTYHARMIKGGKVVIPAELRRELGLAEGDTLVFERDGDKVVLKTYEQVVREVQSVFRGMLGENTRSMVDELIAERRAEAIRE